MIKRILKRLIGSIIPYSFASKGNILRKDRDMSAITGVVQP